MLSSKIFKTSFTTNSLKADEQLSRSETVSIFKQIVNKNLEAFATAEIQAELKQVNLDPFGSEKDLNEKIELMKSLINFVKPIKTNVAKEKSGDFQNLLQHTQRQKEMRTNLEKLFKTNDFNIEKFQATQRLGNVENLKEIASNVFSVLHTIKKLEDPNNVYITFHTHDIFWIMFVPENFEGTHRQLTDVSSGIRYRINLNTNNFKLEMLNNEASNWHTLDKLEKHSNKVFTQEFLEMLFEPMQNEKNYLKNKKQIEKMKIAEEKETAKPAVENKTAKPAVETVVSKNKNNSNVKPKVEQNNNEKITVKQTEIEKM